jgi:hypothetical protein
MEKVCKKCGQSKDEGEFPKMWGWRGKEGRIRSICKKCKKSYERGFEKSRKVARAIAGVVQTVVEEDGEEQPVLPPSGIPDGTIKTLVGDGKQYKWNEAKRMWTPYKEPKKEGTQ